MVVVHTTITPMSSVHGLAESAAVAVDLGSGQARLWPVGDGIRVRYPRMRRLTAAAPARGVIIVGDVATRPELISRLEASLRAPVRPASSPRLVALSGAGLAATAACRHPASAAT